MEITPELVEIVGFFVADGSLQKNYICFWGNISEDRHFYDIHLKNLFKVAFNVEINPHEKKSNSVYGFYVCKRGVLDFFKEPLGFNVGSKTYIVRVPKIILNSNNKEIISAFIRGFCAGDGCLTFGKCYGNCRKILSQIHTYPGIQLISVSYNLIKDISFLLDKLDIQHFISKRNSRKVNEVDSYLLQISGKLRLSKWVKLIGFSNDNHQSKYEIFKKHGFVPPFTTYEDRKKILRGELDPYSFYGPVAQPG